MHLVGGGALRLYLKVECLKSWMSLIIFLQVFQILLEDDKMPQKLTDFGHVHSERAEPTRRP